MGIYDEDPTGAWGPTPTQPTPPPATNYFDGSPLPANFPAEPTEANFMWSDEMGKEQFDSQGFYGAYEQWLSWQADLAQYNVQGFGSKATGGPGVDYGPQYLAAHAQATIALISAEIEAGRLSLDQADSAFNARLDAFAEAGKQRSEMWQYTVAPGQAGQPLHPDIRGSLGMKPWISQPTEINPFAEAQEIVEARPEPSPIPSTDPLQELIELTKGFL